MALDEYKKWCAKRWFLPKDYRSASTMEKITGVYVPFWLADCHVEARMDAIGKQVHTRREGDYQVTTTREYAVRRAASLDFDRIPADGSSKTNDQLMEAVEPFDYSKLENFSMPYLSGFFADQYDVDQAGVFPRIRERAQGASQSILSADIVGYSSVITTSFQADVLNTQWEYCLLPIWLLNYRYRDKDYFFAMNGQSGKMGGALPVSIPKVLLASCVTGLLVFLAVLLIGGML